MDVRQLRYFLVTAQLEHVTHAARKLSIAQPALSQSLHRLEAELGVKLFAREGRNLRLTEEGAYLKDRLSPIISELDSACAGLEAFAIAGANTVNLCIATASVIAVDAIGTFAPQHAETRFDVSRDDASPRNDIVVDTIRNVDGKSGVTHVTNSRADFAERVCIAIPASRPHEEIITLDELADARFISLAGPRRFRSICDELCATRGFEPDVMFESDNPAVVRKMISLGLGVGFWPERSWGPVNGDDVIVLPLADDGFSRTIRLELTSRGLEKEAARAFFEHLVAHFAGVWENDASAS